MVLENMNYSNDVLLALVEEDVMESAVAEMMMGSSMKMAPDIGPERVEMVVFSSFAGALVCLSFVFISKKSIKDQMEVYCVLYTRCGLLQ